MTSSNPPAFTPGPWEHIGQGDIVGIENDPANGCVGPVDVACVYLRTVPGRYEANAALIASAPDLLAALQCASNVLFLLEKEVDALGMGAGNVPEMVRAALAKAGG